MPKTILIIEDEPQISFLLKNRLESTGMEVIVAEDGLAGLEKAREVSPDLILLDVMMPKMNGFEVCRMLKFDEKYKHIPIIILTAKSEDGDKAIGAEVGANTYVTKPFDAEKLLEEINRYFE